MLLRRAVFRFAVRLSLLLIPLAVPGTTAAQVASGAMPTATTLQALAAYPNFFHLRNVVVRGQVDQKPDGARLLPADGGDRGVRLIFRSGPAASGNVEVRGVFWDVGHLSSEDPQVAGFDVKEWVQGLMGDRWPARGELLAIYVTGTTPVPPPAPGAPRLRQLALAPERYDGQQVTVRGQFGGRNLLGDLPQAPRVSRFDFVIRNATAAVWVTGKESKGRGWMLDPDKKLDTSSWVEVTGTVRHGNGLVWIEAASVQQSKPEADAPEPQDAPIQAAPAPPPEVTFSLPAADETDVSPSVKVQFQVSRDLDPETLEGHIKATYMGDASGSTIPLKASFDRGARVLQVTFDQPLDRFKTVVIDVTNEVMGTDKQAMKPYRLTFSVGG